MLNPLQIKAVDIPDAWFQLVRNIFDYGFRYIIDRGSYVGHTRLEYDFITVQITHAYNDDYDLMTPKIPKYLNIPDPVAPGFINQYLPYLMTETKKSGENYTYGDRLFGLFYGNQVNYWIESLKETPNTNQAVLQIAHIYDYRLSDPPCLRHIDMRIKDSKLIFYPYFRSWDLWNGFPANLAAIAVLQKYMADEIGIDIGEMIASSKGLHLYKYVEELAKLRVNL